MFSYFWMLTRRYKSVLSLTVILICAFLYYLRAPGNTIFPSLYAEDGPVFLAVAASNGLHSLLTPYAGYQHLFQRLVSLLVVNIFNPFYYPSIFLAFSWFSYLLPVICSEYLILSCKINCSFRLSYIAYVIYPYAAETYLNLPNSYIFFPLGFILLAFGIAFDRINTDHSTLSIAIDPQSLFFRFFVIFPYGMLSALTGPFASIYLIPLLIAIVVRYKRKALIYYPWFLCVPTIVSIWQIISSQFSTHYAKSTFQAFLLIANSPNLFLKWFSIHTVGPFWGGYKVSQIMTDQGNIFIILTYWVIALLLIVLSFRVVSTSIRPAWFLCLPLVSTYVISFSSLLVSLKRGVPFEATIGVDVGGRFFIWSTLFNFSIVVIAFYLNLFKRPPRFSILIVLYSMWFFVFLYNYNNNMISRNIYPSYSDQILDHCIQGSPDPISIYPAGGWNFILTQNQFEYACKL